MRLKVRLRVEIKNDKIRDYGLSLCCVWPFSGLTAGMCDKADDTEPSKKLLHFTV